MILKTELGSHNNEASQRLRSVTSSMGSADELANDRLSR